jgi:hypothetical protein
MIRGETKHEAQWNYKKNTQLHQKREPTKLRALWLRCLQHYETESVEPIFVTDFSPVERWLFSFGSAMPVQWFFISWRPSSHTELQTDHWMSCPEHWFGTPKSSYNMLQLSCMLHRYIMIHRKSRATRTWYEDLVCIFFALAIQCGGDSATQRNQFSLQT